MEGQRQRLRHLLMNGVQVRLARALALLHVTPNQVTTAGLLLGIASAVAVAQGSFLVGGLLLALGSVLDMVDGALARATGKASPRGGLLDSVFDRLGEAAVLLGLLVYYLTQTEVSWWPPVLVYLALLNGTLVSYVRARAEGLGVECKVGLMTRSERMIVLVAGLLIGWVEAALAGIAVLSALTWMHRMVHVWRALRGEQEQ